MAKKKFNKSGITIIEKSSVFVIAFTVCFFLFACNENKEIEITIVETTDIHGVVLPYDYIEQKKTDASLANISTYLRSLRDEKDEVVLLDNGDILQGQPSVYYYNFIDTVSPHLVSEAFNWLDYDAGTAGNHDIETGHSVYDRLAVEYQFPILAANAVDINNGKPYFKPYVIIEKSKIKIAVFGLITPAIPTWLPEKLYSGIEFRDMVETAKKWMPEIQNHKPDLIVGLFHSGWNTNNEKYLNPLQNEEDGSASVVYYVPGFDIVFTGHDHKLANEKFVNSAGDTVLILNAGSKSEYIARADITFSLSENKKNKVKNIEGSISDVSDYPPDSFFLNRFKSQHQILADYVSKVIGYSSGTITTRDSYFGSSAFVDLIHKIQLNITGADVSFAAPLSFDVKIDKGPVTVGDMFKLYRFENMLYTISLTGEEIKKYLEYSYSQWINTMTASDDCLLNFRLDKQGRPALDGGKFWLSNLYYNFDSAVGIDYIVDVTKPEGKRIIIKSFSNGSPFEMAMKYTVAVNSHRGNGGGGHLMEGVGLNKEELNSRILNSTEKDLRYYMLKYLESNKTITPSAFNNWKFVPENWIKNRITIESLLLFGSNN